MMGLLKGLERQSTLLFILGADILLSGMQFSGKSRRAGPKKKHFNPSSFKHSTHPEQAA